MGDECRRAHAAVIVIAVLALLTIPLVSAVLPGIPATEPSRPASGPADADQAAPEWIELYPSARSEHSLVYDAQRQRVIAFGGQAANSPVGYSDVVWAIEDLGGAGSNSYWREVKVNGIRPSPRSGHTAVMDPANDRMTVFGGSNVDPMNDVWVLANASGTGGPPQWIELASAAPAPAPRKFHSAVYDTTENRMVIFGGTASYYGQFNDAWVLSNANGLGGLPAWTDLTATGVPPQRRFGHAAFLDPITDRMGVFGGGDRDLYDDTWVLENATGTSGAARWAKLAPSGVTPGGRIGITAVYDLANNRLVVFAGRNYTQLSDVWWLDNANGVGSLPTWTLAAPTGIPCRARWWHAAAYDATNDRMLAYGGIREENYTGLTIGDFCALTNAGGASGTPAWRLIQPEGKVPTPRYWHTAVRDPGTDRMIVYAGWADSTVADDVWVLTNATGTAGPPRWFRLLVTGPTPFGRVFHSAVYDPVSNRMVVYGGQDAGANMKPDVWVLNNANGIGGPPGWTLLSPSGPSPPLRSEHSAAYDSVNDRMTVFGGGPYYGVDRRNDVWVLVNATARGGQPAWIERKPAGTPPPPMMEHSAVYDPGTNRMIVFGGQAWCCIPFNYTWVLTNANGLGGASVWGNLTPAVNPIPGMATHSAIYDPLRDRMTVMASSSYLATGDVWTLSNASGTGAAPKWAKLSPAGRLPVGRTSHAAVFDPVSGRMIVFAGIGFQAYDDAWVLTDATGTPGPDKGIITGKVIDQTRAQLAFASVVARNTTSGSVHYSYTDFQGSYIIKGLDGGNYEVRAARNLCTPPTAVSVSVVPPQTSVQDFTMSCQVPSDRAALLGFVSNSTNGTGVAGASLFLWKNNSGSGRQSESDGFYAFRYASPGSNRLMVSAAGYQSFIDPNVTLPAGRNTWYNVSLLPFPPGMGGIIGRSVEEGTYFDVPGATIRVLQSGVEKANATSDATAFFVIGPLDQGWYDVEGSAPGYNTRLDPGVNVTAGRETSHTVMLTPKNQPGKGSVGGAVLDRMYGSPIPGAIVKAIQSGVEKASTVADANGRYKILDLDPGSYDLVGNASGYQNATELGIGIMAGQHTGRYLHLEPWIPPARGMLRGVVSDDATGGPLSGALVRAFQSGVVKGSAVSDASGAYEIANLAPGIYDAEASAAGYANGTVTGVEILPGQTLFQDFRLKRDQVPGKGALRGNVTDEVSGLPIAGATVRAVLSGSTKGLAVTDALGAFMIPGLDPGVYEVHANVTGYVDVIATGVVVQSGRETFLDLALKPEPGPRKGLLHGTVADAEGSMPIGGASVRALLGGALVASAVSDPSGAYLVPDLDAGAYDLEGSAPGYLKQVVNGVQIVAGQETRLDFRLVEAKVPGKGAIVGTIVENGTAKAIAGAVVRLTRFGLEIANGTTSGAGRYIIDMLDPGIYDIRVEAEGYSSRSAKATVRSGETTGMDFQLDRSAVPGPPTTIGDALLLGAAVASVLLTALLLSYWRKRLRPPKRGERTKDLPKVGKSAGVNGPPEEEAGARQRRPVEQAESPDRKAAAARAAAKSRARRATQERPGGNDDFHDQGIGKH